MVWSWQWYIPPNRLSNLRETFDINDGSIFEIQQRGSMGQRNFTVYVLFIRNFCIGNARLGIYTNVE